MKTIISILAVVGLVVLAVVIMCLRDYRAWQKRNRKYLAIQTSHTPLRDDEFCRQAGIDSANAETIGIMRTNLSNFGKCDASRITPDDVLSDFGLNYDDDVAMLVQAMGVIPGFNEFSFPLEDVSNVGGFATMLLTMKQKAEQTAAAAARHGQ